MEEFAGVSGVWTTGGCEEESAGAVEVVMFSFFFFFFGEWEMTFSVFNEGRREGLVRAFLFSFWGGKEGEKELWIYTPLSDFFFFAFWFGSDAS